MRYESSNQQKLNTWAVEKSLSNNCAEHKYCFSCIFFRSPKNLSSAVSFSWFSFLLLLSRFPGKMETKQKRCWLYLSSCSHFSSLRLQCLTSFWKVDLIRQEIYLSMCTYFCKNIHVSFWIQAWGEKINTFILKWWARKHWNSDRTYYCFYRLSNWMNEPLLSNFFLAASLQLQRSEIYRLIYFWNLDPGFAWLMCSSPNKQEGAISYMGKIFCKANH